MLNVVKLLNLVCILITSLTFIAAAHAQTKNSSLLARVNINKTEWSKGDRITLRIAIKNVSNEVVTWPPSLNPYPAIEILDGDQHLKSFQKIHINLGIAKNAKLLKLQPGEEFKINYEATFDEQTIGDGPQAVHGLFLDFGRSAIEIPRHGSYGLRFHRAQAREASEELESDFDVQNVWFGDLVSEPILIVIK
jgi:hypothetical protein